MKESKIAELLSKKNKVKIYMMANKNVTDEEIKILKKQGKFTKLPYMGPKDWNDFTITLFNFNRLGCHWLHKKKIKLSIYLVVI